MALRWTDDARVALRPFATYRELHEQPAPSLGTALTGPARVALVLACCVSWTTSGHLLLEHLVLAPLSWAFLPVIQTAALLITARLWKARAGTRALLRLYFHGHLPWVIFGLLLSLLCLLPTGTWPAFRFLMKSGLLGVLALVAFGWSMLLSYACFGAVTGGSRGRTGLVTATFYLFQIGLGVTYYAAAEQIQPLLGLIP